MHKGKLFAFVVAAVACSSTPTDFAGTYSVTVVDGADNCGFGNGWSNGASLSNIKVTITQDGSQAQATVTGGVGTLLTLVDGTSAFSGTVTDSTLTATIVGKQTTTGSCTYTIPSTLTVSIDSNNNLSGTIAYTPKTNGDASCGNYNSCTNTQTVSGARTGP